MKLFVPDYYNNFRCIADKCRHNCCIGWEIDIDSDTLLLYNSIDNPFGSKLKRNISTEPVPHFILGDGDRCPFLNEKGLCDIITELGDGALCDICNDHPRYRNHFDDRVEMGLGLCCEEAARIILSKKSATYLIDAETGEKADVFPERQKILNLLQDRAKPFTERLQNLKAFEDRDYSSLFYSLERLDPEWDKYIELLKTAAKDPLSEWDSVFEQISVYFILRHTCEDFESGVLFSLFSVYIIRKIAAALKSEQKALSLSDIIDLCRMYSSEIEYSDENIGLIIRNINTVS